MSSARYRIHSHYHLLSPSRRPLLTVVVRPLLSLKRRPGFKARKWSWKEHIYGHGSRRDPKPRMTVLSKASSKLLLCTFYQGLGCLKFRFLHLFLGRHGLSSLGSSAGSGRPAVLVRSETTFRSACGTILYSASRSER
jgi:hypothetical protein